MKKFSKKKGASIMTRTPLEKKYVEYGEVYTQSIYSDNVHSFGLLIINPHSKIASHLHKDDCEWYLNSDTGELVSYCPVGKSHEFANDTDNRIVLLYVKIKKPEN